MNKFLFATALAVLSSSHVTIAAPRPSAHEPKMIGAQCAEGYRHVDRLLAFLYKFDGNLPPIKETKVKHLRNLMRDFLDVTKSEETQIAAFMDLYADADYYQLELEDKAKALIRDLEIIKNGSKHDREIALDPGDISATRRLGNFLSVKNSIRDFLATLEKSLQRIGSLNEGHRLTRSLNQNPRDQAFEIAISYHALDNVILCNLSYLEYERLNRARGTTDRK